MQTLAYTCILKGLKQGGLLVGDVEEMLQAELGGLFMPHGGWGLVLGVGVGVGGHLGGRG